MSIFQTFASAVAGLSPLSIEVLMMGCGGGSPYTIHDFTGNGTFTVT